MSRCIVDLKEDLKFSQVNFVQERNQFQQFSEGLEHELLELRAGCSRLPAILAANEHYEAENNSLRQLLLESSSAIERCKEDMKTVASHHELRVLRNLNLQLDPPFIGQNYPSK